MENWKPVVGYEGLYDVSDHGRIRNARNGRQKYLPPNKKDRRVRVMLCGKPVPVYRTVQTLVLIAFVGPRPPKMECCHNDGDPTNNYLSNLRWDTAKANQADRIKHGTSNRGERCGNARLTLEQVRAIRADTRKQKDIAADFGILQNHVSRIKSGARWAYDN